MMDPLQEKTVAIPVRPSSKLKSFTWYPQGWQLLPASFEYGALRKEFQNPHKSHTEQPPRRSSLVVGVWCSVQAQLDLNSNLILLLTQLCDLGQITKPF